MCRIDREESLPNLFNLHILEAIEYSPHNRKRHHIFKSMYFTLKQNFRCEFFYHVHKWSPPNPFYFVANGYILKHYMRGLCGKIAHQISLPIINNSGKTRGESLIKLFITDNSILK